MKISQSAVQLGYDYQKSTSTAKLAATQVKVLEGNTTNNGDTVSSRAQIIQQQNQTLTDTISSSNQSLVTNTQTGEKQYFESTDFLQSISSVLIEEEITVRSVQALDKNRINMGTSQVKIISISQFESDTQIEASAVGSVITEGGTEIDFMLNLNYERNIQTTQESTFTGQRDLIDPLILNLNGGVPSLSSGYFEFDLNSDGVSETLNQTAQGTGFLAFDKNQNGTIDNGQELFGPNSYSGFAELSQYDDDNNGWIDESDAIFSQLSYMDFDEAGEQRLQSISGVGLGAIYLGSEKMDFDLFDSDGQFQGNIARNGMALKENGQVISLQEIHYSDQAIGKVSMEKTDSIIISNPLFANGNLGVMAVANSDISNDEAIMATREIRVESPLTQFQFDNDIINGRIAETSVRIEPSERPNFITVNGIRNQLSTGISVTNMGTGEIFNGRGGMIQTRPFSDNEDRHNHAHPSSIPSTPDPENKTDSNVYTTRSQRRSDMQAIFKARIEAGFTITNTKGSSSQSNFDRFEAPTLSQSVFWQDERHQYQSKYDGKSKLDQLKQLVNDLKEIREQQVKSQEKLGLYSNISLHKN